MAEPRHEWNPFLKWGMGVLGAIVSSLLILSIVGQIRSVRKQVNIEMRLERLEQIDFPTQFPPSETSEAIVIIEFQLDQILKEMEEVKKELRAHRRYTPNDPGLSPHGHPGLSLEPHHTN